MHRLVNCRFTAWLQISSVQIKKCMLGSLHRYVLVSSPSHSFCPRSTVSLPVSWRKKKTIWFRWRLFYKGAPTGQQAVSSCLWLGRNSLQPLFQWLPASPYVVHSILFNIGHPILLSLPSVSFCCMSNILPPISAAPSPTTWQMMGVYVMSAEMQSGLYLPQTMLWIWQCSFLF